MTSTLSPVFFTLNTYLADAFVPCFMVPRLTSSESTEIIGPVLHAAGTTSSIAITKSVASVFFMNRGSFMGASRTEVKNLAASCEASSIPKEEEIYSRVVTSKLASRLANFGIHNKP
jgi:hypothetical protein